MIAAAFAVGVFAIGFLFGQRHASSNQHAKVCKLQDKLATSRTTLEEYRRGRGWGRFALEDPGT